MPSKNNSSRSKLPGGLASYEEFFSTFSRNIPEQGSANRATAMKKSPSSSLSRSKTNTSSSGRSTSDGSQDSEAATSTPNGNSQYPSQHLERDLIPTVRVRPTPTDRRNHDPQEDAVSNGDDEVNFYPMMQDRPTPPVLVQERNPRSPPLRTPQFSTLPRQNSERLHRTHSRSITDLTHVPLPSAQCRASSSSTACRGMDQDVLTSLNGSIPNNSTLPSHLGSTIHGSFQASAYKSPSTSAFTSGCRRSMFEPTDRYTDEVSMWQRQHQEQLLRQLDSVESSNVGLSHGSHPHNTVSVSSDPHRLESIRIAADNIIGEKDNIIDRLRLRNQNLEHMLNDTGPKHHSSLLRKAQTEIDCLSNKLEFPPTLEDALTENSRLKAQVSETNAARESDRHVWERKLAATEYELSELQHTCSRSTGAQAHELETCRERLELAQHSVREWKDRHASLAKECHEIRQKMSNLEQYLGTLPSQDEHSRATQELITLREDKSRYKQRALELEKRYKELIKVIEARNTSIQSLEEAEKTLAEKVSKLELEKVGLQSELTKLRDGGATIPEEEMDMMRSSNRKLKEEVNRAKKMLEAKERRCQQQELDHQQAIASLKTKLAAEADNVDALRREQTDQHVELEDHKTQIHQLGQQNQDLLDKQLQLMDKIAAYELQYNSEVEALQRKLLRELHLCFNELKSLVDVCSQFAQGQDPNISALLGIKATGSENLNFPNIMDAAQSLDYKIEQLYGLREQIDHLRDLLSTKYAEEVGENLTCITQ